MRSLLKSLVLGGALLVGANAAQGQDTAPMNVIRAGEQVVQQLTADATGGAQTTIWPGQNTLEGYARALNGGDATGFALVQQSGLHRARGSEFLPSRTESWQLVQGLNTVENGNDVRVSLTNPTDAAQSIGTFANGTLRSYTGTSLDDALRGFVPSTNPYAAADQALLGELLKVTAQGNNTSPIFAFSSMNGAGIRTYDIHLPVMNGSTIRGGVPAQLEISADSEQVKLRYMNGCLALNCLDPGVDLSMSIIGPGGESPAIAWRASGNYDAQITVPLSTILSGCTSNATTLCLQNGKFAATVDWRDFNGNSGQGRAKPISEEFGSFWFFNESNNEAAIKMINGCSFNGRYWTFLRTLSNAEMDFTNRDTETNQVLTYHNPLGYINNGHTNIDTIFHCDGNGPATAHYNFQTDLPVPSAPQLEQYNDPSQIGTCSTQGDTEVCFGNRFRVQGTWQKFNGESGIAHFIKESEESGYAWYFDDDNREQMFKIINGCGFNGRYWVFNAGLTNVASTHSITDTWTGDVYIQRNALGVDYPTSMNISTNLDGCSAAAPASTQAMNGSIEQMVSSPQAEAIWNGLETIRARTSATVNDGEANHVVSVVYAPSIAPNGRVDGVTIRAFDNQFDVEGLDNFVHDPEEHLEAKLTTIQTRQGPAYLLTVHPNNTDVAGDLVDVLELSVDVTGGTLRVNNNGTNRAIVYVTDNALSSALKSDAAFDADARLTYQLMPHMMNTMNCIGVTTDCRNTETAIGPTAMSNKHLMKGYGLTPLDTDNGVIAATVQNVYDSGHLSNSPFVVVPEQTSIPADRDMLFWIKHIEPRGEFYTNFSGEGNIRLNPEFLSSETIVYGPSTSDADPTWIIPFDNP